jgi:hypothetical protein
MQVTLHTDPELVNPVKENFAGSIYQPYVGRIITEIFGGFPCYLFGGAVRDPIIRAKYKQVVRPRDFDVLVDDSRGDIHFRERLNELGNLVYSRVGSPKWKPKCGLEIDIVPFSNATRLRKESKLAVSLDTALQSCEFTTGAIAYGLQDGIIYSCGALEKINEREIDLLYPNGEEVPVLMCKAVLQVRRLKFKLGHQITQLIARRYSSDLNEPIREYLRYKELSDSFNFVVKRLKQIKVQANSN